jgi:hypothetical protein
MAKVKITMYVDEELLRDADEDSAVLMLGRDAYHTAKTVAEERAKTAPDEIKALSTCPVSTVPCFCKSRCVRAPWRKPTSARTTP